MAPSPFNRLQHRHVTETGLKEDARGCSPCLTLRQWGLPSPRPTLMPRRRIRLIRRLLGV